MVLTDTHCHLDFERFDADRDEVLRRAWEAGLTRILIPGISLNSSRAAVKLAESHPRLFAAVGVHPNDAQTWTEETINELLALTESDDSSRRVQSLETLHSTTKSGDSSRQKIVAIGEIGLDYYRPHTPRPIQRQALQEQLELAAELGLPVIIHLREENDGMDGPAASDLMKSLEFFVQRLRANHSPLAERPGVLHSFSGSFETAEQAIRLGFYIGVSGPLTYPKAVNRREVVAALPLERLLIETDAPFLAPQSHRGRRNEPAFIVEIADKIAMYHSLSLEEVAAATSINARRLFSWRATD
jgi:TatD DNase family protein